MEKQVRFVEGPSGRYNCFGSRVILVLGISISAHQSSQSLSDKPFVLMLCLDTYIT